MRRFVTHKKRGERERGFTLLLAALIASIVLIFGSSVFSIAQKQITLSSLGRDSQFAFFAADTGAECALYYDIRFQAFATSSPQSTNITCDKLANGNDSVVATTVTSQPGAVGTSWTSTFSLDLFARDVVANAPASTAYCVQVSVTKNPTPPYTVIHSDGYSTSCATIASSPRALQRTIQLQY